MEKRQCTRLFPPLNLKFRLRNESGRVYLCHVLVKDISIGGMAFEIDKHIVKGAVVEGDLSSPDFSISVVGRVAWVKELGFVGGKPLNEVGVEFSRTREENKKILLESLFRYISGTA